MIFAKLLENLKSEGSLSNFKVSYNKERVVIQVPAEEESFAFIAKVVKEIDDFSVTCLSDDHILM